MGNICSREPRWPPEHHIIRDEPLPAIAAIKRDKMDPTGSKRAFPYLFVAINAGKLRMIHALVGHGANPNFANTNTGDVPLHAAVRMKDHAQSELFVQSLLQSGAKPNVQNFAGSTPVHLAVCEHNIPALKLLLHYGGDVNIADRTDRTPMDLCESAELQSICEPYKRAKPIGDVSLTPTASHSTSDDSHPDEPSAPGMKSRSQSAVCQELQQSTIQTDDDWIARIPREDIQLGKSLGMGAFAQVFLGQWRSTPVAVKKLFMQQDDEIAYCRAFVAELKALRSVKNHPNIVLLMGLIDEHDPPYLGIVMEYLPRGSVYDLLHKQRVKLSLDQAISMAKDIARGMAFLHSAKPSPIIHRDLKTPNLLVTDALQVKISDFGLTRKTEGTMVQTAAGTPAWMAPEVLRSEAYSIRADVYSFAIVLWELVTLQAPHPRMQYYELIRRVADEGLRPVIPPTVPSVIAQLIKDCWAEDPHARPLFPVILKRLEVIHAAIQKQASVAAAAGQQFLTPPSPRQQVAIAAAVPLPQSPAIAQPPIERTAVTAPEEKPQVAVEKSPQVVAPVVAVDGVPTQI
eukprot:TRINITY_DN3136_c0_g4_i4.p1 TRINITY_DN3136_c0_g4~~TRINITY_DN3136_c0_g4_i4.p1  ORF type:complete len:572 (+),score=101.65 TRINITY_DN3136_c0_g4_i4:93-1808(+)